MNTQKQKIPFIIAVIVLVVLASAAILEKHIVNSFPSNSVYIESVLDPNPVSDNPSHNPKAVYEINSGDNDDNDIEDDESMPSTEIPMTNANGFILSITNVPRLVKFCVIVTVFGLVILVAILLLICHKRSKTRSENRSPEYSGVDSTDPPKDKGE